MNKVYKRDLLQARIAALKIERDLDLIDLKEEFDQTIENFKPKNLIKRAISNITESNTVLDSITGAIIGLASGYLVKKTLFKKSSGVVMNLIAMLVQTFVTNKAVNNSDEIKTKGGELIHTIIEAATNLYTKYKEFRENNDEVVEDIKEEVNVQT